LRESQKVASTKGLVEKGLRDAQKSKVQTSVNSRGRTVKEEQIDLGNGAFMATVVRAPCWQFLKDYYGGAVEAIDALEFYGNAGMEIEDVLPTFIGLAVQANPGMSPTDARRAIENRGLLRVGADLLRIGGIAVDLPSLGVYVPRTGSRQQRK